MTFRRGLCAGLFQPFEDGGSEIGVMTWRNLGQVDNGFHRLDLAEEQPPLPFRSSPVVQQAPGDGGRVRPPGLPPVGHTFPEVVDQLVLFRPVLDTQIQRGLLLRALEPVSYTHLDVYKRQV